MGQTRGELATASEVPLKLLANYGGLPSRDASPAAAGCAGGRGGLEGSIRRCRGAPSIAAWRVESSPVIRDQE